MQYQTIVKTHKYSKRKKKQNEMKGNLKIFKVNDQSLHNPSSQKVLSVQNFYTRLAAKNPERFEKSLPFLKNSEETLQSNRLKNPKQINEFFKEFLF